MMLDTVGSDARVMCHSLQLSSWNLYFGELVQLFSRMDGSHERYIRRYALLCMPRRMVPRPVHRRLPR